MLRMARRRAGLSQRELARRAGVPQPTVSRIERGQMSPSLDRGQIQDNLRRSPRERLAYAVASARAVADLLARAREVPV